MFGSIEKKSNVFLAIAALIGLFISAFQIVEVYEGVHVSTNKYVGILYFIFDLILIISYKLYKKAHILLFLTFVLWMSVTSYLAGTPLIKAFGSATARNFYMCFFMYLTALLLERKLRKKWLVSIFISYSIVSSLVYVIAFVRAIEDLLNGLTSGDTSKGTFMQGRLVALGNANSLGLYNLCTIVALVYLIVVTIDYFKHQDTGKHVKLVAYLGLTLLISFNFLIMSLARSRGSIVAFGLSLGLLYFVLTYRERNIGRSIFHTLIGIFIAILTVVLAIGTQKAFDRGIINAYSTAGDCDYLEEKLTPYEFTYSIGNLTDRTLIWKSTIEYMEEHPETFITGVTVKTAQEKYINYIYEGRPELSAIFTHNGYLQCLYAYGIPGALMLMILLCYWIVKAIRLIFSSQSQQEKIINIFIIITLTVGMLEMFPFPWKSTYEMYLFSFIAFGTVASYRQAQEDKGWQGWSFLIVASVLLFGGYLGLEKIAESKTLTNGTSEVVTDSEEAMELLEASVTEELKTADYWISLLDEPDKVIKTPDEIAEINLANRKMVETETQSFDYRDIGDKFNVKVLKELIDETYFTPENPQEYFVNGQPTTEEYWDKLYANMNLETLDRTVNTRWGYAIERSELKKYPTEDAAYLNGDKDENFDELAQSELLAFMPVVILHESLDENYYYVLTYGYGGWVKEETIALCKDKMEWENLQSSEDYVIVTEKEAILETEDRVMSIPMGTKLKLKEQDEDSYIVLIPGRDDNWNCIEKEAKVLNQYVTEGVMPFTKENILRQSFKMLGTQYGWAGTKGTFDCSGYLRNIYLCFGLELPRGGQAQTEIEGFENISNLKLAYNRYDNFDNVPAGSILYFSGHVMLYLGNVDGTSYCISQVSSVSTANIPLGDTLDVNKVVVSNMDYTTRASGYSWKDEIEEILILE